ncbi:MAG: universal stress protein, partial [Myxococcaceae bacterium]
MTQRILVPIGRSPNAHVALPVARVLAKLHGATLHVVHVSQRQLSPAELVEKLELEPHELQGLVLEARTGDRAELIVRAAAEQPGTVVVMSTRSSPGLPKGGLGKVAEAVLRQVACPVVFVRPERRLAPWQLRRILLPHDGTPTTSAAIGSAAELAAIAGADLLVAHVAAPGAGPSEPGSLPAPHYVDQRQYEWPTWAGEFLERLACVSGLEISKLRLLFGRGLPGEEVLRF